MSRYKISLSFLLISIFLNLNSQVVAKKKKKSKKIENTTVLNNERTKPVTPDEYVRLLGEGIDVDWVKTSKGESSYNIKMVSDFKKIGFEHVRIRITEKTSKDELSHLEKVIKDCLNENLIPVIAYQAEFFKEEPTDENLDKVVEWWDSVATKFKSTSPLLSFDIIIEVTDALNKEPEILNKLYEKAVTTIRKTNPTRLIFISPRLRSDPEYLTELKIPTNHNNFLMAETHFYASGPSKTNAKKKWTTGTVNEKELILNKIKQIIEWQEKTKIYTWIGAWMPGDYADGNSFTEQEQIVFANFMTCELSKKKIPFAINADHHFYDATKNEWIKEKQKVLKTILTTKCK